MAWLKTVYRTFKSNIVRLIVLILVVAVAITFCTGVGGLIPVIRQATIMMSDQETAFYLESLADKIQVLGIMFVIMFIAVILLVSYISFSKLITDERTGLGCFVSLGASNLQITFKFYLFAFISSLIGCVIGMLLGWYIFTPLLWGAFAVQWDGIVPKFAEIISSGGFYLTMGLISCAILIVATLIMISFMTWYSLKEKPKDLLTLKAPKTGKKVFLEYIPFIWKHLKFKQKYTYRNIFRYVLNLILIVVSIAFATILVFAGFGLIDVLVVGESESAMKDIITPIAIIVIACAGVMAILVLYSLTNINIQSRKREIATLKVLGYRDSEVVFHIYRELLILTIAGIVFGMPTGYLFVHYVFVSLGVGSANDIHWYMYIATVGLMCLFIFLTDLLLYKKILKVDMNSSLKAVE